MSDTPPEEVVSGPEIAHILSMYHHSSADGLKNLLRMLRLVSSARIDPRYVVVIEDSGVAELGQEVLEAVDAHMAAAARFIKAYNALIGKLNPEILFPQDEEGQGQQQQPQFQQTARATGRTR